MTTLHRPDPASLAGRALLLVEEGVPRDQMAKRLGIDLQQLGSALGYLRKCGIRIAKGKPVPLSQHPRNHEPTNPVIAASAEARRARIADLKAQGHDLDAIARAIYGERPVLVCGETFPSARAAAASWGTTEATILGWISAGTAKFALPSELDPNTKPASIWARTKPQTKKPRPSRAKRPPAKARRVSIDGIVYENTRAAAVALGIGQKAIEGRCQRGRAQYIEHQEPSA